MGVWFRDILSWDLVNRREEWIGSIEGSIGSVGVLENLKYRNYNFWNFMGIINR